MNKRDLRYRKFAQEYLIDLNATRAATAAGYSEASAGSKGSQLLKIAKVQRYLDEFRSKRAEKLNLSAEAVDFELACIIRANVVDFTRIEDGKPEMDFSTLSRDQAAAISEIREDATGGTGDGERRQVLRTTVKLHDKNKAIDMYYKRFGLYAPDKLNVTGLENLAQVLTERDNAE